MSNDNFDISTRKNELRKKHLALRKEIDSLNHIIYSRAILENIVKLDAFNEADSVLLYVDYNGEVATREIFESAIWMEKKVYFPKVVDVGNSKMEFYSIQSYEELIEGYQGIYEPSGEGEVLQPRPSDKIFMILPGSVFDLNGYRIGYGKGFYDRYLARYPYIYKCGICFDVQLTEECAIDCYDKAMNVIITEKKTLLFDNIK